MNNTVVRNLNREPYLFSTTEPDSSRVTPHPSLSVSLFYYFPGSLLGFPHSLFFGIRILEGPFYRKLE